MRRSHYIQIDVEKLKKLYVDERYTLAYLADYVFFCSYPTLLNRIKEYNIKRDTPEGKKANYINIDIDNLKDLYYNQKKSLTEMSKIFDCSLTVLINRMNAYNLPRRHPTEHMKKKEKEI